MNVLFLGDIVGAPGRRIIKELLPDLRQKHKIDLCLANADNITHGIGVTRDKIDEVRRYGVDYFTNGDHVFRFKSVYDDLNDESFPMVRPANYPMQSPGKGYEIIELNGIGQVLVVSLLGQVFMRDVADSPFERIDEILSQFEDVHFAAKIVDLHAEATSEKIAFANYVNGRISLVVGTHTHVPTADAQILSQGTGYLTDMGMTGPADSILGENVESVIDHFINKTPHRYTLQETGKMLMQGVIATIDKSGKTTKIKSLNIELTD